MKYQAIYLKGMKYDETDFIPCEICGDKAVDIHHIDARGMGGDPQKKKDHINNLMALCRKCHINYGDITEFKSYLRKIHQHQIELKK